MRLLLSIIVSRVAAQGGGDLQSGHFGGNAQGISEMWASICSVLPFCNLNASNAPDTLADMILASIFPILTACGVILLIYAGIRMVLAQGKDDEFNKAKDLVLKTIIGLILAMFATAVISFVIGAARDLLT